jgi:Rho GDP-dissociation inhibitor
MAEESVDGLADLSLGEPTTTDYKQPRRASVKDILEVKEGEDEALQRYKASLLGAAAASAEGSSTDVQRVVFSELSIVINGRDPLTFDLSRNEPIHIVLKEGCEYRTSLTFVVQNEIVSGLKYHNVVTRNMLAKRKEEEMLGSYPPDPKPVTIVVPRREWEQAPSGMTARATYSAKTTFVDDDGVEHFKLDYKLTIAKDWP